MRKLLPQKSQVILLNIKTILTGKNHTFDFSRQGAQQRQCFCCGTLNSCTGEANVATWPPVAVGEFSPLWRRGQPCGWTVSPTLLCVLCLEGVGLFSFKDFFHIFLTTPRCLFIKTASVFVGRAMADRGVDLSALPKEVRDQLAELDLELSEGKGGEGADGLIGRRDALADFQSSDVLLICYKPGLTRVH